MSVHAIGPDFSYFGIAYLAEKEARLNEKTAKPANKTITAASKVRAVEKQTSNSYDYENDISINEKKGTERKRWNNVDETLGDLVMPGLFYSFDIVVIKFIRFLAIPR